MDSSQAKIIAEFLIADFENEMQTTLRVIETVPIGGLDYRPEAKSKTVWDLSGTSLLKTSGC